jgi:hypothetical protein
MARTSSAKSSNTHEKETGKVPSMPAATPAPARNAASTPAPARNAAPTPAPVPASTGPAQAAATPARTGPTHEQIARRAYEIFLARAGQPGNPEQDWLQAERELRLGR